MIDLDELFGVPDMMKKREPTLSYSLKAMTVFSGAHYSLAIKEKMTEDLYVWWIINDD